MPICATDWFGELCLAFVCENLSFLMVYTGQIKKYLLDWLPKKSPLLGNEEKQSSNLHSKFLTHREPKLSGLRKMNGHRAAGAPRIQKQLNFTERLSAMPSPGSAHCTRHAQNLAFDSTNYIIPTRFPTSQIVLLTPGSITPLSMQDSSLLFLHAT